MSATINHETFVKYFNDAPLLAIPGFAHPVKDMRVNSPVHLRILSDSFLDIWRKSSRN
jgi:ATP-dependent RNA helicase DHX57